MLGYDKRRDEKDLAIIKKSHAINNNIALTLTGFYKSHA
jgi:hypothetical protein